MFLLFTLQVNTKYCRIFIIIHHYIQLPCDCNYGRFSFDQLHYINIFHYLMASKVNEQPATFWYMVLAGKFLFNTNWKKQQRHAINKMYMHLPTYTCMYSQVLYLYLRYTYVYKTVNIHSPHTIKLWNVFLTLTLNTCHGAVAFVVTVTVRFHFTVTRLIPRPLRVQRRYWVFPTVRIHIHFFLYLHMN